MGQGRTWTDNDINQLQDMWGLYSLPTISKRLNRTINAIKLKAQRLSLGRHLDGSELVSFSQFLQAIGQFNNYSYLKIRLARDGFPFKRCKVINNSFLMVDIDKFWKWTEAHKSALDFSAFEENMLGKEPDWVREKRQADCLAARFTNEPWTADDDQKLTHMLNAYKYSYYELSVALRRTEGAVKRRISTLGLIQRPVKKPSKPWTQTEYDLLLDLLGKGYGFEFASEKLNRTALACRGCYERLQNPEYFKRYNRRLRETAANF